MDLFIASKVIKTARNVPLIRSSQSLICSSQILQLNPVRVLYALYKVAMFIWHTSAHLSARSLWSPSCETVSTVSLWLLSA